MNVRSDPAAEHVEKGDALRQGGRLADAEAAYRAAIALAPDSPRVHLALGVTLAQQKRLPEAIAAWREAVRLKADYVEAWANLGMGLIQEPATIADGIAALQQAVALAPQFAGGHYQLGRALYLSNDLDRAIEQWERALELDPTYFNAAFDLGKATLERGEHDRSLDFLNRAVALNPDHADARLLRGMELVRRGDFARGLEDYRQRLRSPTAKLLKPTFPRPEWTGQSLGGKTILLYGEQGLGDTIQHARYGPMLAGRGARVWIACPPELATLLHTLEGIAGVIPHGQRLPEFDYHVSLMELPRLFGTRVETIPSPASYLCADPARAARWEEVLSRYGPGERIGLVWSGNVQFDRNDIRSMPLRRLDALAACDRCLFFSLQKGPPAEEIADSSRALRVIDHAAELNDLADTAALIARLDRVISVCTSVAHLTGALGKPLWLMLSYVAEPRWLSGRSDTPWYPSARLFRQRRPGDWSSVIDQITQALGRTPS